MKLYHGSDKILPTPIHGGGRNDNDFGNGFYCTENLPLAKEWAVTGVRDGYANEYDLNLRGLRVLDFCQKEYTILHWLAQLLRYRKTQYATPLQQTGAQWLIERYPVDIGQYDVIHSYRADDSYFSFARSFLSNEISLAQLETAMKLGKLGEQFVLISPKAFQQLTFKRAHFASKDIYYPKRCARDQNARENFQKLCSQMDLEGVYLRDLMKESNGVNR